MIVCLMPFAATADMVSGQVDIRGSGSADSLVDTNAFPAAFYCVGVEWSEL